MSEFDLLVQDVNSGMTVLDALKKALPPGADLARTVSEIGAGKLSVNAARRALPQGMARPAAPPPQLYDPTAQFAGIDKIRADTKASLARIEAQTRKAEQAQLRRKQRAADDRRQARVTSADTMAKADAALAAGRISRAQHAHLHAMTDAAWDAAALGDRRDTIEKALAGGDLQGWQIATAEAELSSVAERMSYLAQRIERLRGVRL